MVLPISTLTPMITKMISAKRFDSLAKQKEETMRNDTKESGDVSYVLSGFLICFEYISRPASESL